MRIDDWSIAKDGRWKSIMICDRVAAETVALLKKLTK
jgi:hypothetical protein